MAIIPYKQPVLTSNSDTVNGFTVSSNSVSTGYEEWRAFSADSAQAYSSARNPSGGAVTYTIYSIQPFTLTGITFTNVQAGLSSSSPATFQVRYSNNNSDWYSLGTFNNSNNTNGAQWSISFTNAEPHSYYQLNITAANTSEAYVNIGKMQLTGTIPLNLAGVPTAYTLVEYVRSTGGYTNIGFNPNQDTRVVCKTRFPLQSTATWLFGARSAPATASFGFLTYQNRYRTDYNTSQTQYIDENYTTAFTIDKNKNVTSINGEVKITDATGTFQSNCPLLLFANNNGGTATGITSNADIYYLQVYDNGTLVRDLKAVRRASDNLVGFYDLVGAMFYASNNDVAFTAGPDANALNISGVPVDLGQFVGQQSFDYVVSDLLGSQNISVVEHVDNVQTKEFTTASGEHHIFTINTEGMSVGPHTYEVEATLGDLNETASGTFDVPSNLITIHGVLTDYGSQRRPFLIKYYITDTEESATFNVVERIDNTTIRTFSPAQSEVCALRVDPDEWDEGNHTVTIQVTAPDNTTVTRTTYFFVNKDRYAYMRRSERNIRARINLLNFEFQTVDEISGDVVGGSVTIDANSDIRRTCTLQLVAVGSKYNIRPGSRIWLKFIRSSKIL